MRTVLIKFLIRTLNKLEVLELPKAERGYEYFYVSTKSENYWTEWIDLDRSIKTGSVDALLYERKKEGWYIIKMWHTTENSVWHTHWYLARKSP